MGFFKPTKIKVIISIALAISPWIIPYILASLTPNDVGGAYIGAFIFLLLAPTTYLSDVGANLNQANYILYDLINIFGDLLLSYLLVCTIAYFVSKLKQQKQ